MLNSRQLYYDLRLFNNYFMDVEISLRPESRWKFLPEDLYDHFATFCAYQGI